MPENYSNQLLSSILSICFVFLFSVKICAQDFQLPKNSIKVSVLPIFVGEVNFNYERILSKKISGEVALGFVTDNYLMNFLSETNSSVANKILIGPSTGFLFKYYPFIAGDELYIDFEFKYRRYRKRYSQDALDFNEYTERFIPRVGVGYQHFLDEKLFIDFSGNLGLVFQNTLIFSNESVNKTIKLNFGVGLKFGYVF
ncbi:MAG: hypothetical protein ACKO7P_06085 [Bacteroidota bacterium]|nr:hypothetical protein [Bacteroidota bacterium]